MLSLNVLVLRVCLHPLEFVLDGDGVAGVVFLLCELDTGRQRERCNMRTYFCLSVNWTLEE